MTVIFSISPDFSLELLARLGMSHILLDGKWLVFRWFARPPSESASIFGELVEAAFGMVQTQKSTPRPFTGLGVLSMSVSLLDLALTGLTVRVAPIAFGLARSLVFENARNPVLLGLFACFHFGVGERFCFGLTGRRLGFDAFLFLALHALALSLALFARLGDRKALGLLFLQVRLSGGLYGAVCFEEGRLCLIGSLAAVGEIIASAVLQNLCSVECVVVGLSGLFAALLGGFTRLCSEILHLFFQACLLQSCRLLLACLYDGVELFHDAGLTKRLRTRLVKGDLRLLARLVVGLCHDRRIPVWRSISGTKKGQANCLTLVGIMLSTMPVHPWSKESGPRI
ncbi:membrane hypothetical protein [Rhizobium sp. EC-SD404]|nr:membrane hypothetical protein [Rhizobium sp. EC-SD404]